MSSVHSSRGCVGGRTDWRGPHVTKTQLGEHDVVRPMVADKHVFRQVVSICIYLVVNVALTPVWSVTPCCLLTKAGWKICCQTLRSSRQHLNLIRSWSNIKFVDIAQISFLFRSIDKNIIFLGCFFALIQGGKMKKKSSLNSSQTTVTPLCCTLNNSSWNESSIWTFRTLHHLCLESQVCCPDPKNVHVQPLESC